MKYLYLTLSSLIIAYIVLIIFIYFYQRNLLYLPSENNYQDDKIQFNYDEIFIKVDEEIQLKSWIIKKDFKNRLEFMKKALDINPNHAEANYEYGLSLTTNRDFEEAKKYVLKGLELNPYQQRYYPPILCCVGLLEYEDAINFCNKSIEVDPNFTGAYGWKASMLAHLGRMDEAKEILQIYLDLRPEIKSLSDYEKVAPTVIKEVLIDGLRKAGLTE